jgi:hypothetical protein
MLTPTLKRAFLAVAISSLLFACRREVPLAPPDKSTGTESIQKDLVTTRASLNPIAGQPRFFPVQFGFASFDADGTTTPNLQSPAGIVGLPNGGFIISDSGTNKILVFTRATPPTYNITVIGNGVPGFADGSPSSSSFNHPAGLAMGKDGTIYVADQGNNRIRTISPDLKTVSTLAGSGVAGFADGVGTVAKFNQPNGISIDANNTVYIADMGNNMIRRITSGNHVTRWAGTLEPGFRNDTGAHAAFNRPTDITISNSGAAFVTDAGNNRIRKIVSGVVTSFAGSGSAARTDGTGAAAAFNGPEGLAVDSSGNLYIAEAGSASVRMVTPAAVVTTIAGGATKGRSTGFDVNAKFTHPRHIAVSPTGLIDMTDPGAGWVPNIGFVNATKFVATNIPNLQGGSGSLVPPASMTVAPDGTIYTNSIQGLIQKTDPQTGATTPLISGISSNKRLTCDAAGNVIAIQNNLILRITPKGVVSVIAEVNEQVDNPVFDNAGNLYLIALDKGESLIRITPGGAQSRITSSQVLDFYIVNTDASGGVGWFHLNNPVWSCLAADRSTGGFYVGTEETLYRMAADGSNLTPILGGMRPGIPQVPLGGELLSPTGARLTTGDVFNDPRFFTTGITASANGEVFTTNTGFSGFAPPNQTIRANVQTWSPAAPQPFGFIFPGRSGTADDSGPDNFGPVFSTFIGTPYSPALSADGKVLYFLTVTTSGSVNIHKTSAP